MSQQSRNPKRARKKEGQQRRREAELAAMKRQRRTGQIKRAVVIAVLILGSLFLVQQLTGDDDDANVTADSSSTTVADEASTTTAVPVEPLTCEPPSGENTDLTAKPTVPVPAAPATALTCQDLVVGDGEEVPAGATIKAQYVGVAQSNGMQFDASWDNGGEPIEFSLNGVIAGWTQGLPGMKVGGRRLLTIPGDLAYGAAGQAQAGIAPDETLVFIVDVVSITPAEGDAPAEDDATTTTAAP